MIRLVFDCLRAPYDLQNVIQVALALPECTLYLTGKSIRHDHRKVAGKISSWMKDTFDPDTLPIKYFDTLGECVAELRSQGVTIVGTSPHASKSLYDFDLTGDVAIVFGTEVGGLSKDKMRLMDETLVVPMTDRIEFMTLPVVVPVVAYEILRQRL